MKPFPFIQKYRLHHILFWSALLGLWYFFRYQDYSSQRLAFNITLLKVADLAFMVYITNYFLIPKLLYKKTYPAFAFLFILLVFGSSWIKMYIEGRMMGNTALFNLFDKFKVRFYDNIIPHFLLVSTGAGFKLLVDYARAQRRIGEMAKENAQAELNFLKSQINPHFVFNSLNSVYFLIDKQNNEARDALHKFSDMLRYQLYECSGNKTSLEKEVAYLQDYIALQQLRNDQCLISFDYPAAVNGLQIEPLLLIPFVENAFKHVSHFVNDVNEVRICLSQQDSRIKFAVNNTTEEKLNGTPQTQGGIGLKNVKRRLELLYPGKYALHIEAKKNRFNVNLELELGQ